MRGTKEDAGRIRELSRDIAVEMQSRQVFLGCVGATVGDRMLTITAWKDADAPRQIMRGGQHVEAMHWFFGREPAVGGYFLAGRP